MGKVRLRKETGTLLLDFFYQGVRCREQTRLENTPGNWKRLEKLLAQIEDEIEKGTFSYSRYFPGSRLLQRFRNDLICGLNKAVLDQPDDNSGTPQFKEFSQDWFEENEIGWKRSYRKTIRGTLDKHLIPAFGGKEVGSIARSEILKFRSSLAKVRNGKKEGLHLIVSITS